MSELKTKNTFEPVSDAIDRTDGGERWVRHVEPGCWISVLHRMTGFGYMEWETAIVSMMPKENRDPSWPEWKDRDVLIIHGDRRDELSEMTKDQLLEWYASNIEGNRNSMETILKAATSATL